MALAALAALALAASDPAGGARTIAALDLSRSFHAPAGWRFTATQGPAVADPTGDAGETAPGAIRLCISRDAGRTCRPPLDALLKDGDAPDLYAEPHFLTDARILTPRPDRTILLLQVASLHSMNGNQRIATTAFTWDKAQRGFVPVFARQVGRNNNEEVRYVARGPLRGAILAAVPTTDAPFAYWITVDRMARDGRYRQVLRYRSATRYGDGNPLAVLDADMPALLRRLGLWRQGEALPLPAGRCPAPHLRRGALWCGDTPSG